MARDNTGLKGSGNAEERISIKDIKPSQSTGFSHQAWV